MPDNEIKGARALGVSTARSTLIYTIGQIAGSAGVLLLLVILARLLKPAEFGLYAIALAFYTLLSIGAHFGMGTAMRKELPQVIGKNGKVSELVSNGYLVALAIALAIALVAILFSGMIARYIYHDPALSGTLELASGLVFLYALFNMTLATLIAMDKTAKGTAIYLLYSFIQLASATALVLYGYGIFGAFIGLGIGLLVPSLLGLYWVADSIKWEFTRPTAKAMRKLMDFTAPVVASNISMQAPPNLAILLLGIYATTAMVGNYSAAYRFGNFVGVFLISNGFILLTSFAKAFSDKGLKEKIGKIYNSSIYYTLLILLPALIYAISVAQPLVYLLFSRTYTLAPYYFIFIAMGTSLGIISIYAGNLIIGYGDTRKFMAYQLLAVALQIILLAILTPLFKVAGVLLALFGISPILLDLVYLNALHRQFRFKQQFGQLARIIAPSILLLALLYSVSVSMHQSLWLLAINLAATMLIFPPLAIAFGGIRKENTEMIREISGSLRIGWMADYPLRYAEFFLDAKDSRAR